MPAALRKAAGLKIGDEVFLRLENGEIHMGSLSHAVLHAQQTVRRYVTKGRSLAKELIEERKKEND